MDGEGARLFIPAELLVARRCDCVNCGAGEGLRLRAFREDENEEAGEGEGVRDRVVVAVVVVGSERGADGDGARRVPDE